MIRMMLALFGATIVAGPALAQQATPLFASDQPMQLEIRGPIVALISGSRTNVATRDARLTLSGSGEVHAVRLTPRGITRLRRETCQFPPLRVEFSQAPPATSVFAHQRRLKLVTHCQPSSAFQQHLLLEYAAYRLYNLITPESFRARLATIDYADGASARPYISRPGFFIEDRDDVGRRIGRKPATVGERVSITRIDPAAAARVAMFEYMIGNLDWAITASPKGDECCHNSRLLAVPNSSNVAANLVPVPYDFDFSGLVDAPYAVPPDGSDVSVRRRVYRGYCRHNVQARAAAADFRAKRSALLAEIGTITGLDERNRRKAIAYLEDFFADIATDQRVEQKLLARCLK